MARRAGWSAGRNACEREREPANKNRRKNGKEQRQTRRERRWRRIMATLLAKPAAASPIAPTILRRSHVILHSYMQVVYQRSRGSCQCCQTLHVENGGRAHTHRLTLTHMRVHRFTVRGATTVQYNSVERLPCATSARRPSEPLFSRHVTCPVNSRLPWLVSTAPPTHQSIQYQQWSPG